MYFRDNGQNITYRNSIIERIVYWIRWFSASVYADG